MGRCAVKVEALTLEIEFRAEAITSGQFVDVLRRSGLAERRPVDDLERCRRMLEEADLVLTAWRQGGDRPIGVARVLTDWVYAAYLSELAVDKAVQGRGVGKALMAEVRRRVGPRCSLLLLAAPDAAEFYDAIDAVRAPNAFCIPRDA